MTVTDVPIISADSHITEPPELLRRPHRPGLPRPGPVPAPRRQGRRPVRHPRACPSPVPMGLVAAAGKPAEEITVLRREVRRAAPRRLGPRGPPGRPGPRRRERRDHLPDRRAWCCATTTTSTTSTPAWTPTTAGSPGTARPIPDRLFGIGQTAMRTPDEGIADLERIKAHGLQGRDDARHPRRRGLRLARLRRVLRGGDRARAAAVVPHPDRPVRSGPRGAEDQRLHHHRAGLPGRHGHVRLRRRVRAPSRPAAGVRRGRRRLGAALPVPHGPRLQAPPQLAARTASSAACRASTSARTST